MRPTSGDSWRCSGRDRRDSRLGDFGGMSEMRRKMLVALVSLFALMLGAPPASATTDRIPVTSVLVGAEEVTAAVCRQDGRVVPCDQLGVGPFKTLQIRNAQDRQFWDGDAYLQGTAVVKYNFVSAWVCDDAGCQVSGRLWGSITWEPYAFDGGWEGTFSYLITSFDTYGFSYSGRLQATGYGELERAHLQLDAVTDATVPPWEGSHTATGYVTFPGGT